MAIVDQKTKILTGKGVGRFGFRQADRLGQRTYNEALLTNPYAGIFQRRKYGKKKMIVQEKFYWPANPQTEAQQAWRAVFSAGVFAYHALSPEALEYYRLRGAKYHMTGYNKFLSDYLKEHQL